MPTDVDLVDRSGDLKRELMEFARQPRFDPELQRAFEACLGDVRRVDEESACNAMDYFLFQHRLPDRRTLVESFAATRGDLSEQDRAMLLGWQDVVEGLFEVQARDGNALIVVNLVDELTYRVRSNMGTAVFRRMPTGSFLVTRMVPAGAEWLLSGITRVQPAEDRDVVYRAAADLSLRCPARVFRNPQKLARGWEMQRQDRGYFVDFFGTDQVVLPGEEFAGRLQAFGEFRTDRVRAGAAAATGVSTSAMPVSEDLRTSETVGVIYDDVAGLNFYAEFGTVQAAFADPTLVRRRLHRQTVESYLKDDSVSPLPFHRLADPDPDCASRVFQRLLSRPRFQWERDGEPLLRRYKPAFFDTPTLPSCIPISERLSGSFSTPPRSG